MPQIVFTILATAGQRDEIVADFRRLLQLNSGNVDAELSVDTGVPADDSLQGVWDDQGFGDRVGEEPGSAAIVLDVTRCTGSVSAFTMRLSEVLTVRDKQPAEQLYQQILDDAGQPRVPWHVDVRP